MSVSTLLRKLSSNDVKFSVGGNGNLKVEAPVGVLSDEHRKQLKIHKEEIIEYLRMLIWRDFCGVCHARLNELSTGEWECATTNCTTERLKRRK